MSAITRSRMLSRLSRNRIVNTITASAMASGFATGAMKSVSASMGVPGLSLTGNGACSGAASFSMSLIAWAALPMLVSRFGWRRAWIFCEMLWRYSGSFAPSDTACTAATLTMPITAAERAQRHDERRGHAAELPLLQAPHRRREQERNRIASASGISTSCAR